MIEKVQLQPIASPGAPVASRPAARPATVPFSSVLESQLRARGTLRFSAHALQRLESRGISLSSSEQARLEQAVGEVAAKGARESLILMDRLAFVVSVPNRTVITVMPQSDMENAVFTNIDSAVIVAEEASEAVLG